MKRRDWRFLAAGFWGGDTWACVLYGKYVVAAITGVAAVASLVAAHAVDA